MSATCDNCHSHGHGADVATAAATLATIAAAAANPLHAVAAADNSIEPQPQAGRHAGRHAAGLADRQVHAGISRIRASSPASSQPQISSPDRLQADASQAPFRRLLGPSQASLSQTPARNVPPLPPFPPNPPPHPTMGNESSSLRKNVAKRMQHGRATGVLQLQDLHLKKVMKLRLYDNSPGTSSAPAPAQPLPVSRAVPELALKLTSLNTPNLFPF